MTRLSTEELDAIERSSPAKSYVTESVQRLVAEVRASWAERDAEKLAKNIEWNATITSLREQRDAARRALRDLTALATDFCEWADEDEPEGTAVEILHFHEAAMARFAEQFRAVLSENPKEGE